MEASERKTILLVDDNMTNLAAGKHILKDQYKVYPLPSAVALFELLENLTPDLILLDIEMPEMDGYEAIQRLKASRETALIPVIFLTAHSDERSELKGLSLGAVDYINKPFSGPLLMKRIETHLSMAEQQAQLAAFNTDLQNLVQRRTNQIYRLQEAMLEAIADLVEFRDENTGGHVTRTQSYVRLLLEGMLERGVYFDEASRWDRNIVVASSQLHDVGKIAISDAILNKPGKLTDEEFEVMKTHVTRGENIIRRLKQNAGESDFLHHALLVCSGHHERWDGGGYPLGLAGRDIPLEARMMAIADVYDALVAERPYKRPFSTETAHGIITEGAGSHFDPELVSVFSEIADDFARTARITVDAA
jgi:putative two-component system response regulator